MSNINTIFDNKQISVNLLWRFFLRLIGTSREKRTRPEIANYLKKEHTTVYHILNVLESQGIVKIKRERSLKTRTKEYIKIEWETILLVLLELSYLENEEKQSVIEFLLPILERKTRSIKDINPEIINFFASSTQRGKLLKIVAETVPQVMLIVVTGLVLFTNGNQIDISEKEIEEIDEGILKALMDFGGDLIQILPQMIFEGIFPNLKLGNIRFKEVIPQEKKLKTINDEIITEEESPFPFSSLIRFILLFASEGYIYDNYYKKVLLSINTDDDIEIVKPIEIKIQLKDGKRIIKKINSLDIIKLLKQDNTK